MQQQLVANQNPTAIGENGAQTKKRKEFCRSKKDYFESDRRYNRIDESLNLDVQFFPPTVLSHEDMETPASS